MDKACGFTSGKNGHPDSYEMYRAEHSPIRTRMFVVEMYEIPTYVSVHFVRHKIGVEHFVQSNRGASEIVTRDTPVNHMMFLNAQALIQMARKRLCGKSSEKTRELMGEIRHHLAYVDQALAAHMVPECEYRGFCPELKPCHTILGRFSGSPDTPKEDT
jgi:hypothetical protein